MVKRLLAMLSACAVSAALAAPAYRLDRASVALGEPVVLTLTAPPGTLDKLDLTPLSRSFEIRSRNLGSDGHVESMTLTLQPLRIGRFDLSIPGLPASRRKGPLLEVTDGSQDTPRVRLRVAAEPAAYHVRQPVRLTLEACDDGSLMWNRPALPTREGLLVRLLGEQQVDVEMDGQRCTAHRWHWAVTPTAAGETVLPLPMLEATRFGRPLRFPPPPVRLQAMPVPAWLPAEAAIGKPELEAPPLPEEWPLERPLAWRIKIAGGYSAEALRTLLALQTVAQPLLSAYPATVAPIPGKGAVPRHALTLTLLPKSRGTVALPELAFPWYDPATGRIEQLRLPGRSLTIIDPARQRLLAAIALLAALTAAAALGYLAHRSLGWRLRRHRACADLARASDVEELARRLRAFSLRGELPPAPTLGIWRRRMTAQGKELSELVTAVEQALYGAAPAPLDALKQQAVDCIRSVRPGRFRPHSNWDRIPAMRVLRVQAKKIRLSVIRD